MFRRIIKQKKVLKFECSRCRISVVIEEGFCMVLGTGFCFDENESNIHLCGPCCEEFYKRKKEFVKDFLYPTRNEKEDLNKICSFCGTPHTESLKYRCCEDCKKIFSKPPIFEPKKQKDDYYPKDHIWCGCPECGDCKCLRCTNSSCVKSE